MPPGVLAEAGERPAHALDAVARQEPHHGQGGSCLRPADLSLQARPNSAAVIG